MRTLKEIVRKELSSEKLDALIQRQKKAGRDIELLHYIIKSHDFSCKKYGFFEIYNSELKQCDFTAAEILHPVFGEVFGTEINFSCAVFKKGEIIWSKLPGAVFRDSIMSRMYFFETDLSGADFTGADLTAASFIKCNLNRVVFKNTLIEKTRFEDCSMKDVCGMPDYAHTYTPVMFSSKNHE
ncbi:MAG: pentapeptide repeat-containing protein [Spirochaetales bacterium]|nr:pentapeptide repeat-containing protein [Spirochaetales bacterium]